jgi:hypothetical protein
MIELRIKYFVIYEKYQKAYSDSRVSTASVRKIPFVERAVKHY